MSNQSLILARIKELRSLISKWNRHYYFEQNPVVTDATYDRHYQELLKLESNYPEFQNPQSPTQQIGYWEAGNLPKIIHQAKMLSLKNAFQLNDLENFDKRVSKITFADHNFLAEAKIDGLSLSVVFKNHKFVYAATRGNGQIGENVTNNVLEITGLKKLLNRHFPLTNFELRGEVFLNKKNFLKLNQRIDNNQTTEIKNLITKVHSEIKLIAQKNNCVWKIVSKPTNLSLFKNFGFLCIGNFSKWNAKIIRTKNKNQIVWKFLPIGNGSHLEILKLFTQKIKNSSYKLVKNTSLEYEFTVNFTFSQIPFLNSRNVASGSLRQLDSKITKNRNLSVLFYELITSEHSFASRVEQVKYIEKMGFPIISHRQICTNLPELKNFIQHIESQRHEIPYAIDGVVIKINQKKFDKALGATAKTYNHSIAYKFSPEIVETKVIDIFPTVGRTGRITYNAKLEKVYLDGSVVSAATLHNSDYIEEADIRVGDTVAIKKAGEIIPKVLYVNKNLRTGNAKKWIRVEKCLVCHSKLMQKPDEVDWYCVNKNCEEKQIRSLVYFASLEAMNIFGLSEKNIRALWKNNLVRNPVDFYHLFLTQKTKLLKLAQNQTLSYLGPKSIDNLIYAVEQSRNRPWWRVLTALSIRHVGARTSRLICEYYSDVDSLLNASIDDLMKIKNIGIKSAKNLYLFFKNSANVELLRNLQKYGLGINKNPLPTNKKITFFTEKKVVITGSFSVRRSILIEKLLDARAKIMTSVTSQTDFLFVGVSPGSKLGQAQKLGIKIITEAQLKNLINF